MRSIVKKEIIRYRTSTFEDVVDCIVQEEPLEIYLNSSKSPLLVTMRTSGSDEDLCLGLLFNMGILTQSDSYHILEHGDNAIRIKLSGEIDVRPASFYTSSSCGLCNRPSWEDASFHSLYPIYQKDFFVNSKLILKCFSTISEKGDTFHQTGGNHKITLMQADASILAEAEDVGRHNAFDKVVGHCIKNQLLPLRKSIAILSGRCSYEMCQKAWLAGIPIIACLGAPTSKAVDLAEASGITLIGFLKKDSYNIYSHSYRINREG